ncbi:glycosyl transferase family 2 [Flavobacterium alvei]|uniref:Glycosyl transferase family 2 n=1 Tax=Flavobacterium alvei TaxID=2080416 RepID=A0A2S5AE72_9FLAO|nr:glycosyltransferase [Flavobacterium alvei]POY40517.1 glycosyl transferase family 2 [Flavobacterium alvei]HQE33542.1 glycosyltransferase [Flavobacterium alvei]HQF48123.1 glycosyltransferase [Flavobacterium alvei]HQK41150.1 glycosyltransferase [Flavobacterium alvei]
MTIIPNTTVVIPCYNEEKGISNAEYSNFLNNNPEVLICFVNDGSKDNTLAVLTVLKEKHPTQIQILSLEKNAGKAEAVRAGINHCNLHFQHRYIGYLDADLATTLEEFIELRNYLQGEIVFSFGSRIRKIGSIIERENSRFLIGRVVATFISNILDIKVYDTQCGSKLFTREISEKVFEKEFISRWLFDVEIFYRMIHLFGKEKAIKKMIEVPLKLWVEKGDSKVKFTYGFKLWFDLFEIQRKYKKIAKNLSNPNA